MAIASPILIWFKPATALDCKVLAVVFIWFLENVLCAMEQEQAGWWHLCHGVFTPALLQAAGVNFVDGIAFIISSDGSRSAGHRFSYSLALRIL